MNTRFQANRLTTILARRLPGWLATWALLSAALAWGQPPVLNKPTIRLASAPEVSQGVDIQLQAGTGYGILHVQWRRNGQDIPGANQTFLELRNVQPADAGDYTVLARNADGEAVGPPLTLVVDPTFVAHDVRTQEHLESGEWIDVDGDGWLDLSGNSWPSFAWVVLLNCRDGGFAPAWRYPVQAIDTLYYRGYGDYDNDGDQDMVGGINPATIAFENLGGANFRSKGSLPGGTTGVLLWMDLDQDGYLDLFRPQIGSARVHLNNRLAPPFRMLTARDTNAPAWALTRIEDSLVPAWGDYDGDGRMDLFVSDFQAGRLYRNVAPGVFEPQRSSLLRLDDVASLHAEWVDYDGDGDLDLAVNPFYAGAVRILRNDDEGRRFTRVVNPAEIGPLGTNTTPNSCAMAWGDFDNDGDLDLYRTAFEHDGGSITRLESGRLWVNDGRGRFERKYAGSPTTGLYSTFYMASWGDYDNDGFLDLFGSKHGAGGIRIYHNNLPATGNLNRWLKVKCIGRVSNRDAIGTTVRLKATLRGESRWQVRQVVRSGGGGPLVVHFGLADAPVVEVLRVQWPTGLVQEFTEIAVNQSLVLREPPRLKPAGPTSFEVACWKGMCFGVEASTDLQRWTAVGTVMNTDGTARFDDAVPVQGACRFYRVVER